MRGWMPGKAGSCSERAVLQHGCSLVTAATTSVPADRANMGALETFQWPPTEVGER